MLDYCWLWQLCCGINSPSNRVHTKASQTHLFYFRTGSQRTAGRRELRHHTTCHAVISAASPIRLIPWHQPARMLTRSDALVARHSSALCKTLQMEAAMIRVGDDTSEGRYCAMCAASKPLGRTLPYACRVGSSHVVLGAVTIYHAIIHRPVAGAT